MRSAIFSALVFIGSSAAIHLRSAALSRSAHMLRTLRGWAVVVFAIALILEIVRTRSNVRAESRVVRITSAVTAFVLFSFFLMLVICARAGNPAPWVAGLLTALGTGLAPVMTVMALEFPDLRPPTAVGAAVVAGCLVFCAGIDASVLKPAKPGIIRTRQPIKSNEPARWKGPVRV
jgi:hypothetical protein